MSEINEEHLPEKAVGTKWSQLEDYVYYKFQGYWGKAAEGQQLKWWPLFTDARHEFQGLITAFLGCGPSLVQFFFCYSFCLLELQRLLWNTSEICNLDFYFIGPNS